MGRSLGASRAGTIGYSEGRLTSEAVGEIVLDGKILVLKRIHVTYTLRGAGEGHAATIDRLLARHAEFCPVAAALATRSR